MKFDKLFIPKHIKKIIDESIPSDLPVCTRFPPQPSGYLHIGHLFACRLNQSIATFYGGKFLVRFDDTNPEVESNEYTSAIIEDLIDCGFYIANLSYTSDSFQLLLDKATELVRNGYAYVDFSTQEQMAEQRKELKSSVYRENTIEKNMSDWNQMISGTITDGCLRLLAFPDSKNGAMRDPVLYRSIDVPHHRTRTMFKIYPTYDFACPILDSVDGVTHVFRSKEYCERDDQMKYILNKLNMRIPRVITYGRISIGGCPISKREIKKGIEEGLYSGWDDKKLFTYRGMRNKGISLSGINKFLDDIGFPESNVIVEKQKVLTINKKVIDINTTRLIGIADIDTLEINININKSIGKIVPNFIGNKSLGERMVVLDNKILISKTEYEEFNQDEELTIIYIGNAIFKNGELFEHPEGNPKTTSKKILWLNPNNYVKIELELLDSTNLVYLIESHILNLEIGSYVQLNKVGYFYLKQRADHLILVECEV